MKTLHTNFSASPVVAARRLSKLERCGRYEEALDEIGEIWKDISTFPDVEIFELPIAAELLLRCGSLLGFLGHNKQIADSQQNSKNILTEARSRFLDLENTEKVAECENYLALAYWRTGESNESEIWLNTSLAHDLPVSSLVRLHSYIIKCLIFLANGNYREITLLLDNLENDFLRYGDDRLKGDFYNNFGIALNELGERSKALNYFEQARFFHQKSQHKVYLGTVENNLAQLYKLEKQFVKAHAAIDSATRIFRKIKDKTREGFSLDTKAQIFLAEKRFPEALQSIKKAISIMDKSENMAYLVETLMTKTKILVYLDDFSAATFCLFEAVKIANQQISEAAAQKLVKDFEIVVQEKNNAPREEFVTDEQIKAENVELVLPPELENYTDIQGIWMNNSHFEKIGLHKGSMAVIARENVKPGDLAAVLEKETDEVSCGFYDADFGIVCLEKIDSEPQLFDEDAVTILGKIVGVCYSEKTPDGKMIVQPLKF